MLPDPVEDFVHGDSFVYEGPECQIIIESIEHLSQLTNYIDDMLGDHYVDYLDWYMNRCRELEDKLELAMNDLKDLGCIMCKKYNDCIHCDGWVWRHEDGDS
jgi:hypothetical protein